MLARIMIGTALVGWLAIGTLAAPPTAEEIKKAEKAVDDKIKEFKGGGLLPTRHIGDDAVVKLFANHLFFAAHLRQYPVGIFPGPGSKIKTQNLFVVAKDAKVEHLTDARQLEKFFQDHMPPAKDEAVLKNLAHAWLSLSPEFLQDGFYKFKITEDATRVAADPKGKRITGQVVVMQGGSGEIIATLIVDGAGKLVSAIDQAKVRAGPRPICQATKLVDPDPIVRRMAEQDLLIMGRAAQSYLMEHRARATPELQRAIDLIWQRIIAEDR
jgi:hypothetical protein